MTANRETIPPQGRVAGIDYGTRRMGVAISDPAQSIASPLETRHCQGRSADLDYFRALAEREGLVGFVVGLPVHLSGDESPKSAEARRFAEQLRKATGLPVCLADERYTSVLATDALQAAGLTRRQRRGRVDKLAAQILLVAFLESSRDVSPDAPLE